MKPGLYETLERIAATINERKDGDATKSYVAQLFAKGEDAMLKKIGEEATETVLAAKAGDRLALVRDASSIVGNQCIVVAIDAKRNGAGWEVYTHGGRRATGIDAIDWAKRMQAAGAGEILLTSMDRDGTRDGFDLPLTRAVSEAVGVPVIASGGAGDLEHLARALLEGKADAVLAASIFHFGDYTVQQAKEHLRARGIEVRT